MGTLTGVGSTAALIAAGRAVESQRPDRLFDDPWASRFVAAAGFAAVSQGWPPGRSGWFTTAIPVRTKFLDDYLCSAVERGCRQVVLLGAGLDTRALRLSWPSGVRFFEVDTDSVLSFKDSVLGDARPAHADRRTVRVDLRDDWPAALRTAGFGAETPTAWIAEGLFQYLEERSVDTVLTGMADLSASGSELGMSLAPRRDSLIVERPVGEDSPTPGLEFSSLWKWDCPDDAAGWLARYGWRAEVFGLPERARAYGRELPDPVVPSPGSGYRLVSAVRT